MPLYVTSLRLSWDIPDIVRRKWSNVFYVDAPNADAAAAAIVGGWTSTLRDAARERIFAYEVYATSLLEGDDDFVIQQVPIGFRRGTLGAGGFGEAYEPTSCVSVTIPVGGSRPSRKFWRPGLFEGDVIAGQTLNASLVAAIEGPWQIFLENLAGNLRDPDGQPWGLTPILRYTRRRLGRESAENLPTPPPLG